MRSRKLGWIVVTGGLTLGCISSAYGTSVPIAYEAQDRSVSANSTATGFFRGGTDTTPMTDTQSQSQQANGMGIFASSSTGDLNARSRRPVGNGVGPPRLASDTEAARSVKAGSAEEQDLERRVLARLASGEPVKVSTLRTATSATLPVLAGLTRKKWIARETAAVERDARRMERFAVLIPEARLPALTAKQQAILAELAACDGELPLAELRRKDLPSSTLQTLVRRGLVRIDERPAVFRLGGLQSQPAPLRLNEPQTTPWPAWRRLWVDSIPFCFMG